MNDKITIEGKDINISSSGHITLNDLLNLSIRPDLTKNHTKLKVPKSVKREILVVSEPTKITVCGKDNISQQILTDGILFNDAVKEIKRGSAVKELDFKIEHDIFKNLKNGQMFYINYCLEGWDKYQYVKQSKTKCAISGVKSCVMLTFKPDVRCTMFYKLGKKK